MKKKVKGLVKEHICITRRHRQQCSGQREEGVGAWWRCARGGGDGVICNSVNNKNKEERNKAEPLHYTLN